MDDCTLAERWLPVVGYEGHYEVSNQGRVRSVTRVIIDVKGAVRSYFTQIRKQQADKRGCVSVSLSRGGVSRPRRVHHLVLEAFVGLRPPGTECCHADDDPGNNWDYNLSWGSRSDNMQDRIRNGINPMSRRVCCPIEHKLVVPNLVACFAAIGRRGCLACARARSAVHHAAKHGRVLDFHAAADRHYRAIMGADAA